MNSLLVCVCEVFPLNFFQDENRIAVYLLPYTALTSITDSVKFK